MLAGSAAGAEQAPAAWRTWREGRGPLVLAPRDVHVWRALLDDDAWALERLRDHLAEDERRRAGAFCSPRDGRRFTVCRGVLRLLLARYVHRAPSALRFRHGPSGKPALAVAPGDAAVAFSCSRSGGLALFAFARGRRVGIDVEAVRALPEAEGIAELCFSPGERSELAALPPDRLEGAILRAWTMKEAYAKAVGDGLTRPFDGIEVPVAPTPVPALRAIDGDAAAARRWSLRTLSPADGYTGALVVEGRGCAVGCWTAEPRALIDGSGSAVRR